MPPDSGDAKKREKNRPLDNAVAGTSKIRSIFVTTTAGEDETSEGNPGNRKSDAVDVTPSVPAPEDEACSSGTNNGGTNNGGTNGGTSNGGTNNDGTNNDGTNNGGTSTTWTGSSGVTWRSTTRRMSVCRASGQTGAPSEILSMGPRVRRDATGWAPRQSCLRDVVGPARSC